MKYILFLAILFSHFVAFSQSIEMEGVNLPSTETFELKLAEEYAYRKDGLQVIIGRHNDELGTGVIKLIVKTGMDWGSRGAYLYNSMTVQRWSWKIKAEGLRR